MGLGGINASTGHQEVSREDLESTLSILKRRFIDGSYPDLNERIDRITRLKTLVENNTDDFHKALENEENKNLYLVQSFFLLITHNSFICATKNIHAFLSLNIRLSLQYTFNPIYKHL